MEALVVSQIMQCMPAPALCGCHRERERELRREGVKSLLAYVKGVRLSHLNCLLCYVMATHHGMYKAAQVCVHLSLALNVIGTCAVPRFTGPQGRAEKPSDRAVGANHLTASVKSMEVTAVTPVPVL